MGYEAHDPYSCFTCNQPTDDSERHSIFFTFLDSTGDLLADVLERCILLPQLADLPVSNPVLCGKCCALFEEFAAYEKKVLALRRDLWTMYSAAVATRNGDVGNFIRGITVQTESNIENFLEHDEGHITAVVCKTEHDVEDYPVDEESRTGSLKEELPVAKKWWKRRGKWFKGKAESSGKEQESQVTEKEAEVASSEVVRHECSVCSSKFEKMSEYRAHVKSHDAKSGRQGKHQTHFDCRLCGRKYRSKAGAIYHAKSHNFEVDKAFDMKEVFRIFVDGAEQMGEEGQPYEGSTVIIVHEEAHQSSSDDELPLANRRDEFLLEKIKESIKMREKTQKPASESLEALKNCPDVKVLKLGPPPAPAPVDVVRVPAAPGQVLPPEFTADDQDDPAADGNVMDDDFGEMPGAEDSDDEDDDAAGRADEHMMELAPEDVMGTPTGPRKRGRPRIRQITLSQILKMRAKQRRNKDFLPAIKEPRFKCEVCGKMWKTRGELNAHTITHSDARPYICEICGQAYKHKPALDVHVGMHRGIYEHQCPYCKKAFTQKGALQRHLPIHTGDLPYQCELCGKRFVHRTSFSIHTMAHTGVRNIKCEVCNMGVLSKSHLRRHMRIHSGEKPYDCPTCGKAFAERYNLVAHQRIHDPNPTGPARTQKRKRLFCRLCNVVFERRQKLEEHMVLAHNRGALERQQQQLSNNSYETPEIYTTTTTTRYIVPDAVIAKIASGSDQLTLKKEETPSVDLTVRSVHSVRSVEVLRSGTDVSRGVEILRMANGMVEATHSWGYSNSAS